MKIITDGKNTLWCSDDCYEAIQSHPELKRIKDKLSKPTPKALQELERLGIINRIEKEK